MLSKIILTTKTQQILTFLLMHPDENLYEREISRQTKISFTSTNRALKELHEQKIINKTTQGKMCYYKLTINNNFLKKLKILTNMLILEPLVENLKNYSEKIILFGSTSRGEDNSESDIDIFIVSSNKDKTNKIIEKHNYSKQLYSKKIQAIINTPTDMLNIKQQQEIFMDEVRSGIVLWERTMLNENYI